MKQNPNSGLFSQPTLKDNLPTSAVSALIGSHYEIQSTLVISNTKGLSEMLRDIRTSTYQICRIEEKNKSNNHI